MSNHGDEPDSEALTADCASEPIHIPDAIQPHGSLVALDLSGRVIAHSENLARVHPELDQIEPGALMPDYLVDLIGSSATLRNLGEAPDGIRVGRFERGGAAFTCVFHRLADSVILEFEPQTAGLAADHEATEQSHTIARALQRQMDPNKLLDDAVRHIRSLTRFDRVMAYRFLPDWSGEVVAEARRPEIEPYLGLRYPASDIPEQARRLYELNPIRMIPDVNYEPARLRYLASTERPPIDLSHAHLRSVSPVHIQYLKNMGVGASFSISLIRDGRLWGLIACHHGKRLHLPYGKRSACLMLGDSLGLLVARAEQSREDATWRASLDAREKVIARVNEADDLVGGIVSGTPSLLDVVASCGAAVTLRGRIATIGLVPSRGRIRKIAKALDGTSDGPLHVWPRLTDLAPGAEGSPVAGLLATTFSDSESGHLMWFREEAIQTVRWAGADEEGGKPDPLTPRASFQEYVTLHRGSAEPWTRGERDAARSLGDEVQRAALRMASQNEQLQALLIGILGHDLRNPLNAISLSAAAMSAGGDESGDFGGRIERSTNRMDELIRSMLDYSTIRAAGGLAVKRKAVDAGQLLQEIVDETRSAYPGADIEVAIEAPAVGWLDATRFQQLVSNLLSNARHHGDLSHPIEVKLESDDKTLRLSVSNHGPAIPEARRNDIFNAFQSSKSKQRTGRVGLGLYICREITLAHGGQIRLSCPDERVRFDVELPSH